MSLARGTFGALLCGGIGAGLWCATTYFTGYEVGLLAIVVGGCAGFGMGYFSRGRGGAGAGVMAALVAAISILGGKLATAHFVLQDFLRDGGTITPDDAYSCMLDEVWTEFDEAGEPMTEVEDDYPPEVVAEAEARWTGMSLGEQESYAQAKHDEMIAAMRESQGLMTSLAFLFSLGFYDILWLGLAMGTAYKGGSTRAAQDGEGQWHAAGEDEVQTLRDLPAEAASPIVKGGASGSAIGESEPRGPLPAAPPSSARELPKSTPSGVRFLDDDESPRAAA